MILLITKDSFEELEDGSFEEGGEPPELLQDLLGTLIVAPLNQFLNE